MHSTTGISMEGKSLWTVFDSWAKEPAHTGFVKGFVENWKGRAGNKQLSTVLTCWFGVCSSCFVRTGDSRRTTISSSCVTWCVFWFRTEKVVVKLFFTKYIEYVATKIMYKYKIWHFKYFLIYNFSPFSGNQWNCNTICLWYSPPLRFLSVTPVDAWC